MQILERYVTHRVFRDVDNAVATVETRVNVAVLAAMDSLIKSRVESAIKPVNTLSGRDI